MRLLKEIYEYREMIFRLVRRELRGRYKGSALGFLWTFLNPLLQLAVYTFVFSTVMRTGMEDYYLFLFVALIPWIFFSTSLTGGAGCVWSQKELVKKIYFPREVLPVAFVTSQFVNMLLSFLVVFFVLLATGKGMRPWLLPCLVPILLVEYIMALGAAFLSSALTVYFRDLEYVLGIVAMAWQFLSPVMYSVDLVPEKFHGVFFANPMTPVIAAYRDILYYGRMPELQTLLHAFVLGLALLSGGAAVFSKLKRHFAEEM